MMTNRVIGWASYMPYMCCNHQLSRRAAAALSR
jgi:hypothetical protein